jgi:hypothetical protein
MRFYFVILLLIISCPSFSNSQLIDTNLIISRYKYLENLIEKKGNIQYIAGYNNKLIKINDRFHSEKPQLFIKIDSSLFLTFSGSGRLYKLTRTTDSLFYFSRLDSTENINYNLGAYYFSFNKQLFSFGGYGFWQNFGSLKFFNFNDRQWDIVPLSEEVIPQVHPTETSWFDQKNGKFFVPLQSKVNAGIIGTENLRGKIIPYSYSLDLASKQWTKLGKTNQELINIIYNGHISYKTSKGLIFLYFDKVYFLDFNRNKLLSSSDINFNQSIGRKSYNDFPYEHNGYLYSLNRLNGGVDSLKIDYAFFKDTGIPIWEPAYDFSAPLAIGILLISATAIVVFARRKKKTNTNVAIAETKYKIQFTDTEVSLLKLLIEKEKKNERADINEVNYVLGLKHKNTGLQKKVRSDTFNSINEKFKYISKSDEVLIQSIRSEIDKRYFEYYITKQNIELLKSNI